MTGTDHPTGTASPGRIEGAPAQLRRWEASGAHRQVLRGDRDSDQD